MSSARNSLPPVAEASAARGCGVGALAGRDRVDDDLRVPGRFDRLLERRLRAAVASVGQENEDLRAGR